MPRRLLPLAILLAVTLLLVYHLAGSPSAPTPLIRPSLSQQFLAAHSVNKCDSLPSILIVSSHFKEDLSWLYVNQPFPVQIYQKLTSKKAYAVNPVFPNHGQEATAYLKYILDNYDTGFPDVVVFLHGHETAWHVCELDGKMSSLLRSFRFTKYPFANFKYTNYYTLPKNWYRNSSLEPTNRAQFYIAKYWQRLYSNDTGVPEPFASHCCAQFAVSRGRIYQKSKGYYQNLYDFLQSGEMVDFWNSRMMEMSWSLVFGEPGVTPYRRACELYHCTAKDEKKNELDPVTARESRISKLYKEYGCKNWVRVRGKDAEDWVEDEYKGVNRSVWSLPDDLWKIETTEAKPRNRNRTKAKTPEPESKKAKTKSKPNKP